MGNNFLICLFPWIKVFTWRTQLTASFYGPNSCLEVEFRDGEVAENQSGRLGEGARTLGCILSSRGGVSGASPGCRGCRTPWSLSSEEGGPPWSSCTVSLGINFHKIPVIIHSSPFCSCLGNCEQLDTCYVNYSWIFLSRETLKYQFCLPLSPVQNFWFPSKIIWGCSFRGLYIKFSIKWFSVKTKWKGKGTSAHLLCWETFFRQIRNLIYFNMKTMLKL